MILFRMYPERDTYRLRSAGAQGAAVFSGSRAMVIKDDVTVSEKELIREFPDADIIILEGFKYSEYPKVEVVRREVSSGPVCDPVFLLAVATDFSPEEFSGNTAGFRSMAWRNVKRNGWPNICASQRRD